MTVVPYKLRTPNRDGVFENQNDLNNELTIQKIVENKWKCRLIKQQTTDPMDYIAARSIGNRTKTVALVEMRARSVRHDKYQELFFGKAKYIQLLQIAHVLWIPAMFVVTFTDCIKYIDLTTLIRPKTTYGSRGDMQHKRATDNEPVILIPINKMVEIKQ